MINELIDGNRCDNHKSIEDKQFVSFVRSTSFNENLCAFRSDGRTLCQIDFTAPCYTHRLLGVIFYAHQKMSDMYNLPAMKHCVNK